MIAAAVLVHGSIERARNIPVARALARNGVATLTYDKRDMDMSEHLVELLYPRMEPATINADRKNLDLLAEDASAAVKELINQISSPLTPIGMIGISQAGWIIPVAAVRTPEVKFMILWSGPLVTTHEQLRFQFFTNADGNFWDHHTEAEARAHIKSDADRYSFVDTDPSDSLRNLSIPGLWIYGARDISVPTSLSIDRLESLIASGKPFKHFVFPDAGHELPFREVLSTSMDWLRESVLPTEHGS